MKAEKVSQEQHLPHEEWHVTQQMAGRVEPTTEVDALGLQTPIMMYCARRSWASIARSKNAPISVISEGMGHDSEATT